jgi:hypothetical protein
MNAKPVLWENHGVPLIQWLPFIFLGAPTLLGVLAFACVELHKCLKIRCQPLKIRCQPLFLVFGPRGPSELIRANAVERERTSVSSSNRTTGEKVGVFGSPRQRTLATSSQQH